MKKFIVSAVLLVLFIEVRGQTKEIIYSNPKDSTTNYYIAYRPAGQVKGLLLLLTSFGETPQNALKETTIHKAAVDKGIVTVYASLQSGTTTFFVDSLSQQSLDTLITTLQKKYNNKGRPFYAGGFSLGGSGVVKYAERAYQSATLHRPSAIFAIDPPLDFERMYTSLKQEISQSKTGISTNEADYFIKRIEYEFHSTPQENIVPFHAISPYSYSDTLSTNIRSLINCPIRLITEPDMLWQMEKRNRSLYSLNVLDCSSAINSLKTLGSNTASLILTSGKGYRKLTGKRNPHSWSIANGEELINWLLHY